MKSILKDTLATIEILKADGDAETLTGTGVDMQGFDGVCFFAGALHANIGTPTMKAQQDTDAAFGASPADLLGTSVNFATTAELDGLVGLEIIQPRERYVRPILTIPNWNAVPVFCLALRFKAHEVPQTNAGEVHVSPAEGTA